MYIIDNSVRLGRKKCFVTLGTTMERLKTHGYQLTHQQVDVLKLEIIDRCYGALVNRYLDEVAKQYGVAYQIVADNGTDIKKGIELFCQQHPQTIYTYDVTHKMANLLKDEIERDTTWQTFQKCCAKTRNLVLQTELAFLAPPQQKVKARYMNVKPLLDWRSQIRSYQAEGKYPGLDPVYQIDGDKLKQFGVLGKKAMKRARSLSQRYYYRQEDCLKVLETLLSKERLDLIASDVLETLDISRERFQEKFDWIEEGEEDVFKAYQEMLIAIESVEEQLKKEGLSKNSYRRFSQRVKAMHFEQHRSVHFCQKIINYLKREGDKLENGKTVLATSDIIESLFGKYKLFDGRYGMKGIGKMVLTLPALTTEITLEEIKTALETAHQSDLLAWVKKNCGESLLAKRNVAFGKNTLSVKKPVKAVSLVNGCL